MSYINDYLDWRGDIDIRVDGFNEVDNYIISKIGTLDFSDIVPFDGYTAITDAVELILEKGRTEIPALTSKSIVPCVKRLPGTIRFSGLKLWGFESRLNPENTEQFSALTVILPDGTNYVSFRGTDDTIIAWKEDFLLGVQDSVQAQHDAVAYLKRAAHALKGPIIVGGHSKGGNLAVYAAANVPKTIQRRIVKIYNNDGPGFTGEFLTSEGYLRIRDRLTTIISQHSIVGTLLEQDKIEIVRSGSFGIAAHDGFTWEVKGPAFVRCAALSRTSTAFDSAIKDTLAEMDTAERKEFVDQLFSVLTSTGASTVSDFSVKPLEKALELAKSLRTGGEVKKFVSKTLEQMLRELSGKAKNTEDAK